MKTIHTESIWAWAHNSRKPVVPLAYRLMKGST
jgi:hypothetical protein